MYLAVIVLPLLGSMVSGFFGRKVGVTGAQVLSSLSVLASVAVSFFIFFEVSFNNVSVEIFLFRWLDIEVVNVFWGFNFDFLTVSMLIPVLVVSCLVHIYSVGYMSHDPHNQRFFSYLSLFTFMMIILVTSNNFLLMFVGWEGVGICSYLLVNFWYTRLAANQSSISALLTNRVGDCLLTIGMFILLLVFGNLDYATIFSIAPFISENCVTFIGICLLIGAMAKSSQIGLHVWLPLAMEGPTPVSALIHAATMVTAGVYLLMRASPLIEYSSTVLVTCLWVGSVTTVFSSVIGLFQQDIKKVIAYSTMSQLGMMMIAIGLSCYNVALFHLVNHAFYKGLLFLGAGAVIHAVFDNQDFRKYGGLILFLPLTYAVMLIASLSLAAFPFMTGFYSKDFILECSFAQFNYSSITVYFTAVIGAIFTTLYSVKVLYLTFIANPNAPASTYAKVHEADIFMSFALIVLALFSIFFGFVTKDIFIGLGSHAFSDNSLFIHPVHELHISSEFAVPSFFKLLPFGLTLIFIAISIILLELVPGSVLKFKYTRLGYNMFAYLNLKFLVESLYNRFIIYVILNLGGQTTKVLDKGTIENIGPYGLERFMMYLSRNLNVLNTGVVTTYALYILVSFMLYITLPLLSEDTASLFIIMFCAIALFLGLNKKITKYNTNDIFGVYSGKITMTKNIFDPLQIILFIEKLIKSFDSDPVKPVIYYKYKGVTFAHRLYVAKSYEQTLFTVFYWSMLGLAGAIAVAAVPRSYAKIKQYISAEDKSENASGAVEVFNQMDSCKHKASYYYNLLERTIGTEYASYVNYGYKYVIDSQAASYVNFTYQQIADSQAVSYVNSTYQQAAASEYASYIGNNIGHVYHWVTGSKVSPCYWYVELGNNLIDHPFITTALFGSLIAGCVACVVLAYQADRLTITDMNGNVWLVNLYDRLGPTGTGIRARFGPFVHFHWERFGFFHRHNRNTGNNAPLPDSPAGLPDTEWSVIPGFLQRMRIPETLPALRAPKPLSQWAREDLPDRFTWLYDEHFRVWNGWSFSHLTTAVKYYMDYADVICDTRISFFIKNPLPSIIPNFATNFYNHWGANRYPGNWIEIGPFDAEIGTIIAKHLGFNYDIWLSMLSVVQF